MVHPSMDVVSWLRKELEADGDLLREMVQAIRSPDERRGSCPLQRRLRRAQSGAAERPQGLSAPRWDRRVGTIDLAIPKLRRGSYYPDWLLDPRPQPERAWVTVVAECYLAGVSTRRVDDLVRTLGIQGISKSQVSDLAKELDTSVAAFRNRPLTSGPYPSVWLDALTQRCRDGGRIVNVATVLVTAVNADGHREIWGVEVLTNEDGMGWTAFLRSLVARGLSGLQLAISDPHPGLKDAIAPTLPRIS